MKILPIHRPVPHCAESHPRASIRIALLMMLLGVCGHSASATGGGAADSTRLLPYRDYAMIRLNCATWQDAFAAVDNIVGRGGTVSALVTPRLALGWIPAGSMEAVQSISAVAGLLTSIDEGRFSAMQTEEDPAAGAAVDHFRAVKSGHPQIDAPAETEPGPREACMSLQPSPMLDFARKFELAADSLDSARGYRDELFRARMRKEIYYSEPPGDMTGILNVDIFMMESWGSSSKYDWTPAETKRVSDEFLQAFDFWSSAAKRYGKSVTFRPVFFTPTMPEMHIGYEPAVTPKSDDWKLVQNVMENLGYKNPWHSGGLSCTGAMLTGGIVCLFDPDICIACAFSIMAEGEDSEIIRVMKWNEKRAGDTPGIRQSFCAFVKYHPADSPEPAFRDYAKLVGPWAPGEDKYSAPPFGVESSGITGVWIMIDAKRTPLAPVISHESAHIFGAPDEYQERVGDTDCPQNGFFYRGSNNGNCIVTHDNSVRGIMRETDAQNLKRGEISSFIPVHIGWTAAPGRMITFTTDPPGIPMTLDCGIKSGETFTGTKKLGLALGYQIKNASVPGSFVMGGLTYYFRDWLANGARLYTSMARSFTVDAKTDAYTALYDTTGGGLGAPNSSLEARLGVFPEDADSSRSHPPGIVLVWRTTLYGSGSYKVEMNIGTSWIEVKPHYMHLPSGAGEYCYAILDTIAGEPVRSAKSYTLRVVPYSGLGSGRPSNEATITTRPAVPESGTFCYDGNEPNNAKGSATPLTLAAGIDSLVLQGAIHYSTYGNVNDIDVYRLTISDLTGAAIAVIQVSVKPGSNFQPYPFVKYTAAGKIKTIEAKQIADDLYQLVITDNGAYDLYLMAAGFGDYYGSYLVSPTSGQGSWGEYAMTVKRQTRVGRELPCPVCFEISPSAAGLGRIFLTKPVDGSPAPGGKYSRLLMPGGMPLTTPLSFRFIGEAEPGSSLMHWEGDFPGTLNPFSVSFNPLQDRPGLRTLMGFFQPVPDGIFELVYSPPTPYRSILGDEQRYQGPMGTEIQITIPDAALNGFDFLGWDGEVTPNDIVAPAEWERSPSIRIRLTRHMRLIPMIAPRPCTPDGIGPFTNTLHITNATGVSADLLFGMQPGAGDGLEAGQTELPPVPPPGVADFRFINIPGIQGSFFDIRAVKPSHTFQGRLQPGDNGDPVLMSWNPIPSSVPGSFFLKIGNEHIDMRTRTRFSQTVGSSMTFTIAVTRDTCRQLPSGTLRIAESEIDSSFFPVVHGRICLEDSLGNPYFNLRQSDLSIRERDPRNGQYNLKAHLRRFAAEGNCYRFELLLNDTIPPTVANNRRGFQLRFFTDEPASEQQIAMEWNIPALDAGPDTTNGNGRPHAGSVFNSGPGWHLFSLPMIVRDPAAASFFSTPFAGPLFGFDPNAGLQVRESAIFGQGYWVHFSDSVHIRLSGLDKTMLSISGLPGTGQSEADGWNLIGALSRDADVASIAQTPAGAILSIFGFDKGYKSANTLKPGEGYWVRLKPDATLGLVSKMTGGTVSRRNAFPTGYDALLASLPHQRDWTIRDAEGAEVSLFTIPQNTSAQLSPADLAVLGLPPRPPAGAFDARFAGNSIVCAESDRLEIDLQGIFPLTLRTAPNPVISWDASRPDGTPIGCLGPETGFELRISPQREGAAQSRIVLSKRAADAPAPAGYALGQNYPNPFTAAPGGTGTRIDFSLPVEAHATLVVYDLFGREVRALRRESLPAGYHSVSWNGMDDAGRVLPPGVYIYELRAGGARLTKNLLIIR